MKHRAGAWLSGQLAGKCTHNGCCLGFIGVIYDKSTAQVFLPCRDRCVGKGVDDLENQGSECFCSCRSARFANTDPGCASSQTDK